MRTGICSITFRNLCREEIVRLVKEAQLDGIEWGGDVHVPHGDLAAAKDAKRLCADNGLAVSSYGSYYRLGEENDFAIGALLDTAEALGTDMVRVWPGRQGSDKADAAYREKVANDARALLEDAVSRGIRIGLEYHGNSLTDTIESALDFLKAVDHPSLTAYFQKAHHRTDDENIADLKRLLPRLSNLHVFYWVDHDKRPLAEGRVFFEKLFREATGDRWALMEFVREGTPEQFLEDAAVLRKLLNQS